MISSDKNEDQNYLKYFLYIIAALIGGIYAFRIFSAKKNEKPASIPFE
jgi:hypothetical protein